MNISEVAKLTGLTAKAIRFYESKGIIKEASRGANGIVNIHNIKWMSCYLSVAQG